MLSSCRLPPGLLTPFPTFVKPLKRPVQLLSHLVLIPKDFVRVFSGREGRLGCSVHGPISKFRFVRQDGDLKQEPLLFEASYEIIVDGRVALFGVLALRSFDRSGRVALFSFFTLLSFDRSGWVALSSFFALRSFDRARRCVLFGFLGPRRFDGSLAPASHQWSYLRVGIRRQRTCLLDLLPCGVQDGKRTLFSGQGHN